jgi:hypothetical protein
MDFGYLVPYSYRGNLLHLVNEDEVPDWQENEPFRATLSVDWMEPGAAIKRVMVLRGVGENGRAFPMFVDDVVELLKNSVIDHGIVTGLWRVKRTGRKHILYTIVKVGD